MSNLTQIEKDALLVRLQREATNVVKEHLAPFINECYVEQGNHIWSDKKKAAFVEQVLLQGMCAGLYVYQDFLKELKENHETI